MYGGVICRAGHHIPPPHIQAPFALPPDTEEELTALKAAHALLQQRYDSLARQHRRLQFASSQEQPAPQQSFQLLLQQQQPQQQQQPSQPPPTATATNPIPIPIPIQPSTLSTPAASPRSAFSVSPDKRPLFGVSPDKRPSSVGLSVSPDKKRPSGSSGMGLSVSVSPARASSSSSKLLFRAGSGGNRGDVVFDIHMYVSYV